ncbi:MAG TPA: hypothetical protein PLU50_11925, partial [Pseudobdellovibrionaceae bacterium]|nr:hypothetical protein [Pseudobdellovibrionaceae bacterium]
MGERSQRTTLGKALEVNLRNDLYGAFAEIGAGQEVARFFFTAGKASQTIAKTISAYDMTISDEIYGREKSGRYVCESRLVKMLDHEYSLLVQRLQKSRGDSTRFFAFANTVTTQPPNSNRPSHGWMGVRFQATPNGPTNEIILHVRMLDKYRLLQQEALGILGVNLIHTAFFCSQNEDDFIPSIVENLKDEQIVIDVLKVRGEGMKHFNEALLNLELVNRGISEAILFSPEKEILNISDAVFGKSLLFQRGIFRPITVTHLDIQAKGLSHIKSDIAKLKEGKTKKSDVLPILEITTRSLEVDDGHVNEKDFLDRVEAITSLGQHVLISRFNYFYELKQFFRSYTPNFMANVIG